MKRIYGLGLLLLLIIAIGGLVLAGVMASGPKSAPWFTAVSGGNGYDALLREAGKLNASSSAKGPAAGAPLKTTNTFWTWSSRR